MADIKARTAEIIRQFKDLARFSRETQIELDKFIDYLQRFTGDSSQFLHGMSGVVRVIDEMAISMRGLGYSESFINAARIELIKFAGELGNLANIQSKLASMSRAEIGPATSGLLTRLGPLREQRRAQAEQQMRAEAGEMARLATSMPIGDIALAGGDLGKILVLRREQNRLINEEQKRLLAIGLEKRKLVQWAQERLALQERLVQSYRTSLAISGRRGETVSGDLMLAMGRKGYVPPEPQPIGARERRAARLEAGEIGIPQIVAQYRDMLPGAEVGVTNLTKKLESFGVTSMKVTQVTQDLNSGLTTFRLRTVDNNGVVRSAIVRMDRWGGIVREMGGRFKGFTAMIGRNIIKVTQWGIATAVVYGILRKFNDLLREVRENESRLADIQIALGKGAGDLNEVFEASARIANETSSSIKGVLEGYALAYAAAGGIESQTMRTVTANILLRDSMVLAKLAGIDQARALDTLVGALRQAGLELHEGIDLIDKWVAVSRTANVSMDTLASTYAIVGATAQGVGIDFEHLNAIAATLAEATKLSADETGNAIRGIIAGFQTTRAEQFMAGYGIATKDATGKLRDFTSLMYEISDLFDSGRLSPRDLTQIATAIGGGYRRGAQVEALFRNVARVQELIITQSYAQGQAQAALEIKMETLQSATTRLGNAFSRLAQTLGVEGGFLDSMKNAAEFMSLIVNVLNELTKALGTATPAIMAFAAAMAVSQTAVGAGLLGRGVPAGIMGIGTAFKGFAARQAALGMGMDVATMARLQQYTGGAGYGTLGGALGGIRQGVMGRTAGMLPGRLAGGIDIVGAVVPALMTLQSTVATVEAMAAGDTEEASKQAFRTIAQTFGAVVGGILGGPLGMTAGAVMGAGFVEFVTAEPALGQYLAQAMIDAAKEPTAVPDELEELDPDKILTPLQNLWAQIGSGVFSVVQGVQEAVGMGAEIEGPVTVPMVQAMMLMDETIAVTEGQVGQFYLAVEQLNYQLISSGDVLGEWGKEAQTAGEGLDLTSSVINKFIVNMQRDFLLGQASLDDLRGAMELLGSGKMEIATGKMLTAFKVLGLERTPEEIAEFLLKLDIAGSIFMTQAAEGVLRTADAVKTAMDVLALAEEGLGDVSVHVAEEQLTEARRAADEAQQIFTDIQPLLEERARFEALPTKAFLEAGVLTQQEVERAIAVAQRIQHATFLARAEGDEELIKIFLAGLDDAIVKYGEGLGATYQEVGKISAAAWQEALEELDLEPMVQEVQFQFRDLREDLAMGDLPDLLRRYEQVKATFAREFPLYDIEESPIGLILKDGFHTMDADLTLLNLAMQDLIDISEQQLEGVWNIPAGMTAMVAWSSLFTRTMPAGGAVTDIFAGEPEREPFTIATEATAASMLGWITGRLAEIKYLLGHYEFSGKELTIVAEEITALKEQQAQLQQLEPGAIVPAKLAGDMATTAILEARLALGLGGMVAGPEDFVTRAMDTLAESLVIQNRIELNANIRLVVDGRTLANVVKQYLFEDLVGESNRSGYSGWNIQAE